MSVEQVAALPSKRREDGAVRAILREIAVGGLAGLVVGILLGGIGGRLVMRFAALVVPESVGAATENGTIVGDITVAGTLALIVFVGLFAGALAGSIWVTIEPWLPVAYGLRALVSIPIAIAVGTRALVEDHNPDFAILGHDPLVVASLVLLIAAFGPAMVLADAVLDRRLPRAGERPGTGAVYAVIAALGVALTAVMVVPAFLGTPLWLVGVALIVVGIATLVSWALRIRGQPIPSPIVIVGRGALIAATLFGFVVVVPEITGALGMPWR
ncbi:MAG TPA: hypothetical protein VF119_10330 [Candidatus Limnocylindrales bacterium]